VLAKTHPETAWSIVLGSVIVVCSWVKRSTATRF
jgi:hypothetical protein